MALFGPVLMHLVTLLEIWLGNGVWSRSYSLDISYQSKASAAGYQPQLAIWWPDQLGKLQETYTCDCTTLPVEDAPHQGTRIHHVHCPISGLNGRLEFRAESQNPSACQSDSQIRAAHQCSGCNAISACGKRMTGRCVCLQRAVDTVQEFSESYHLVCFATGSSDGSLAETGHELVAGAVHHGMSQHSSHDHFLVASHSTRTALSCKTSSENGCPASSTYHPSSKSGRRACWESLLHGHKCSSIGARH